MKVSLIVPVYNTEEYLDDFMSSVLAQSYQDFEVILVDDCSTDKSGKICDTYAREYPFCRVFHHKVNQGAGAARNTGLDNARGEFIAFADPDDLLSKHYLEKLVQAQQKTQADVVIAKYTLEYVRDHKVVKRNAICQELSLESNDRSSALHSLYTKGVLFLAWCKLMKSEIIQKNGIRFRPIPLYEDALFQSEYYRYAHTIAVADEFLYFYRVYLNRRVTLSRAQHDTLQIYSTVVQLLNAEQRLIDTMESEDASFDICKKLRAYSRNHFLQYTLNTVLNLSKSSQPQSEKLAVIRKITADYAERQKGHEIWNSGRKKENLIHFLLMHRMDLMILLMVNIRRRKKRREA